MFDEADQTVLGDEDVLSVNHADEGFPHQLLAHLSNANKIKPKANEIKANANEIKPNAPPPQSVSIAPHTQRPAPVS